MKRKLVFDSNSIIAATAVVSNAPLVSNDAHLAKAIYPHLSVESFI
ncbi:MAG: hypothetical protein LBG72_09070 [Spirochaetaceae bacterium]|nr:hypothetical protein [Spirochaetaceae bacterium]